MTRSSPGRDNRSFAQAGNQTFSHGFSHMSGQKKRVKQVRRENGWDAYVKPISKYNEAVHGSMKISFERI
jgi:carbohydrate-selective porin OprB